MARNKLSDLNDHLFAQLERLSDEDMKAEDLKTEISRAKAIEMVSKQVLGTAKTVLDAAKLKIKFKDQGYEFNDKKFLEE